MMESLGRAQTRVLGKGKGKRGGEREDTSHHCNKRGEEETTRDHDILIPIQEAESMGGLVLLPGGTETETIESHIPIPVQESTDDSGLAPDLKRDITSINTSTRPKNTKNSMTVARQRHDSGMENDAYHTLTLYIDEVI